MSDIKYVYTVEFESYDGGGLCGIYISEQGAQDRLEDILFKRSRNFKRRSKNIIKEWSDCFGWGDARYRIYKRKIGVDIGVI